MRYTSEMRAFPSIFAALCVATAAAAAAQQKPPKTVTISGCVARDDKAPDQYTLTDAKAGATYKLTGKDFREYLGRRVQIDGGVVVKGLAIRGGLQPNPNVAAQAGAMDPSRAAVQAATSGSSVGPAVDVQEFRVKEIRPASGSCDK